MKKAFLKGVCFERVGGRRAFRRGLLWASLIALPSLAGHAIDPASAAIIVTPVGSVSDSALRVGLGGTGLTIDSVSITNGTLQQFGTYTNFTSGPVTFADGVVLSTGRVVDTPAPASPANSPDTDMEVSGTTEFDTYGPGNIANFSRSNDVARLEVNFTLSSPSAVSFDFIFGSIEYPEFTNVFTDAFLVFLDGTTNQIVFDPLHNPVQVGLSFASLLTTADQNTAFADPHGLVGPLTTTTPVLAAGSHTLLFEVGDVNDHLLDSAVFIANLRTSSGPSGTAPTVPLPAAAWLFSAGLVGLAGLARRRG